MKKKFLISLFTTLGIAVLFFICQSFNLFNQLDFRLYDALFHLKKEPEKKEQIVLIEIDDTSIQNIGEWPWSRDILGNVLLRLKEFNAQTAVFDIEYISPSKKGISPDSETTIKESINNLNLQINENLNDLANAISKGYYSSKELPVLTNQLIDQIINPSFNELASYINNNISRDNDAYFAECLKFFGNSWLTVNNRNIGYESSENEIKKIQDAFLIRNVYDPQYRINIDNDYAINDSNKTMGKGFVPSLYNLVMSSNGLGFTNSTVDSDGERRRMELLYEYNGKYLGQLVFAPLINLLNPEKITRTKKYLILENCTIPESSKIETIKIPLDNHGRLLINWRHGEIEESFNFENVYSIIQLDEIEKNIILLLSNIYNQAIPDEKGFPMDYTKDALNLINLYSSLGIQKNKLLDECKGFDNVSEKLSGPLQEEYEAYFSAKKDFLDLMNQFILKDYLPEIKKRMETIKYLFSDSDFETVKSYFEEDFSNLNYELSLYNSYYTDFSKKFNNAFCIIGETAASTTDLGATPFNKKYANIGIHANVLNTILNKSFIRYESWYLIFIISFIIQIALCFLSEKAQHVQNNIGGLVLFFNVIILVILFVIFDIYTPMVGTILYVIVNYLTNVILRFVNSNREKKFLTLVASSFANKDTVDLILKNPESFKTEGEKKEITALFSDIQKFSTFSETITEIYGDEGPNKLIEVLNEYLGNLSNQILLNNGTIDKYEGDAIISMFGAPDPLKMKDSSLWAYLSLDSAIKMKKAERLFNDSHKDLFKNYEIITNDGKKKMLTLKPFQTRIGINSGEAFVGLMGSKTDTFSKLNYTMIGDTVNLASRLEGVNKAYGSWIMCSDSTWNLANKGENKDKILVRKLDKVRVVGRSTPVQLYNVMGLKNELTPSQIEEVDIFHAGLDFYLKGDFIKAGKFFTQSMNLAADNDTSRVFAERCKNFIENGVPDNWDGVITLTSK